MTLQARGRREPADFREDLQLIDALPVESFKLLLRAARYAQNSQQPVWNFTTSVSTLRTLGLQDCDLRWLVIKGYLDHAYDASARGAPRITESTPPTRFTYRSTFVLTSQGTRFVECLLKPPSFSLPPRDTPVPLAAQQTPLWDAQLRELRIGCVVIKHFSVPAENQETILSSFQEEAWPAHLDDPLPPVAGIDAKRRLHSTIRCLNRNQKSPLLRFHGDGYGRGVYWKFLLPVAG
jgi:hypothetical protein